MAEYRSPKGDEIKGTMDNIPGIALISGVDEHGEPEYIGETDVLWDDQTTLTRNGKKLYVCESGDLWTFDQLVKVEEKEDEE